MKRFSALLTALVLCFALCTSAFAAEILKDNSGEKVLSATNASTGTREATYRGSSVTVLEFPAGTAFSMADMFPYADGYIYVDDGGKWEKNVSALYPGASFTLPDDNTLYHFQMTNIMGGYADYYIIAGGSAGAPSAEPSPAPVEPAPSTPAEPEKPVEPTPVPVVPTPAPVEPVNPPTTIAPTPTEPVAPPAPKPTVTPGEVTVVPGDSGVVPTQPDSPPDAPVNPSAPAPSVPTTPAPAEPAAPSTPAPSAPAAPTAPAAPAAPVEPAAPTTPAAPTEPAESTFPVGAAVAVAVVVAGGGAAAVALPKFLKKRK